MKFTTLLVLSGLIIFLGSCHKFQNPWVNGSFTWKVNNEVFSGDYFTNADNDTVHRYIIVFGCSSLRENDLQVHLSSLWEPITAGRTYIPGADRFIYVNALLTYHGKEYFTNDSASISHIEVKLTEKTTEKIAGTLTGTVVDLNGQPLPVDASFDVKF